MPIISAKGNAGIEPDMRRANNVRVRGEPGVLQSVWNNEGLILGDCVLAECILPWCLAGHQAITRFVPLAVRIEQRHDRYWDTKYLSDDSSNSIEGFLSRRIQHVVPGERFKPLLFALS